MQVVEAAERGIQLPFPNSFVLQWVKTGAPKYNGRGSTYYCMYYINTPRGTNDNPISIYFVRAVCSFLNLCEQYEPEIKEPMVFVSSIYGHPHTGASHF